MMLFFIEWKGSLFSLAHQNSSETGYRELAVSRYSLSDANLVIGTTIWATSIKSRAGMGWKRPFL